MFSLFSRAARYASLTPAERAFLRLVEGLVYVALLGAATACAQYLAGHPDASSAVDWQPVLQACAAGAAVAVLMALAKYFKAHGDPALGDVLAGAAAQLPQASQSVPGTTSMPIPADASAGAPPAAAFASAADVPGGVADSADAQAS